MNAFKLQMLTGLIAASLAASTAAADKEYSPYVDDDFPNRVLFGDTHLHSSWSTDIGMAGATAGPDVGYRLARGETVTAQSGFKVKLNRPLDFLVMSDHAENLGLADYIRRSDPLLLANKTGKRWHDMVKDGKGYDAFIEWLRADNQDLINDPRMTADVWQKVVANADKYYQPGVFTTFHGFEWTSHPGGNNLHRVVIFRDGGDKTSQVMPYSQYDSVDPEDLWQYLADYEQKTEGRVMSIAHNGNLSNGLMFDTRTYQGKPLTRAYAETRTRFEPIYEATQQKGDSEAHPKLSPEDEFADFENFDKGNISGKVAKTDEMLAGEYVREALKEGLRQEDKIGVNPFKFGMIGASDNHTSLPTTREENNFGKGFIVEPSAQRAMAHLIKGAKDELSMMNAETGASGLAAVWARENTREAIWDAMARREVYATTGTRLQVRVFAGWDFDAKDLHRPNFAKYGYQGGVPMGGDLIKAPKGKAPSLLIKAQRDPDGANLDRIQVIKGWLDGEGNTHERIYDLACADDRAIVERRCNQPVGSTVDVETATYDNSIGDPLLETHWVDPDFNPAQRAFYYVRVLEIPTPRWSTYDMVFFNNEVPAGTPLTVQDRAYTSPIWYTP